MPSALHETLTAGLEVAGCDDFGLAEPTQPVSDRHQRLWGHLAGQAAGAVALRRRLGNTACMGTTWVEWTRFALIPILAVLITAFFSTRNAKKTPHERLKNLVEIQEKMPDGLDFQRVVRAAIARELVDFDRRLAADQKGVWAGLRERIAQFGTMTLAIILLTLSVGVVSVITYSVSTEPHWGVLGGAGSALVAILLTFVSYRESRRTLRVDRAAALVLEALPRVALQEFVLNGSISIARADFLFDQAERLESAGILTRLDAVGEYEAIAFAATPFGKGVLEQSLREADRQHVEKWESIARDHADSYEQSGPGDESGTATASANPSG